MTATATATPGAATASAAPTSPAHASASVSADAGDHPASPTRRARWKVWLGTTVGTLVAIIFVAAIAIAGIYYVSTFTGGTQVAGGSNVDATRGGNGVNVLDVTADGNAKAQAEAGAALKKVEELEKKIVELEGELETIRNSPVTVTPEQVEEYNRKVDDLRREYEEKLSELKGELTDQIAALGTRLASAEQTIAELSEPGESDTERAALAAIPKRLDIEGAREEEIAERCPHMRDTDKAHLASSEMSLDIYAAMFHEICGSQTGIIPVTTQADIKTDPSAEPADVFSSEWTEADEAAYMEMHARYIKAQVDP